MIRLLVVFTMALAVFQVVASNRYVSYGRQLTQVREQIRETAEENEIFEKQIASASALLTVSQSAESLGLTVHPTEKLIY